MTEQLTQLDQLRRTIASWRAAGDSIALVPTMGALHAGHLSLVAAAKAQCKRVVVSIYVNPTQFGPSEDFTRYPRPLAHDLQLLADAGADAAWLPTTGIMYPEGFATTIHIKGITDELEGAFRPGYFDGVATVVCKLLNQAEPDFAFFGEKDYQQLCVIKRLAKDLDLNIRIIGVPTMREADGLALSSRNQYLSTEERNIATSLHRILQETATQIRAGHAVHRVLREAERELDDIFLRVDYIDLRDAETFAAQTAYQAPGRLLAAVWLGTTRLIDNIPL